jgi:hypothetical protein
MFTEAQTILRDLGNGLVMRRSTSEDAEALAEFQGQIQGENEADRQRVAAWTRDLLALPHPTFNPDNFTIVEEIPTRRIVSSLCLIPQTWSYEGIEFGVGRPELVATLPEFRDRGLVRLQFEEIHKWCVERGLPVQIITGIPYYYRLFGYEMALDLDGGHWRRSKRSRLKDGETDLFVFVGWRKRYPIHHKIYRVSISRVRSLLCDMKPSGDSSVDVLMTILSMPVEIIERVDSHEPVLLRRARRKILL